jgi:hypothetical protein
VVVGDHERDLLALEAHAIGGQHRLPVGRHRRHPGHLSEVVAGEHGVDLRVLQGGRDVDRHDLGVRLRRAQDRAVQQLRQLHVVHVAALAADEAGILLARQRPEADHVSPLASNTATLTVLHRPHLIRTRLVIDSSPIDAASTLPHSTQT